MLGNVTEKRSKRHEAQLSYANTPNPSDDEIEKITAPLFRQVYSIDGNYTPKKMSNFSFRKI